MPREPLPNTVPAAAMRRANTRAGRAEGPSGGGRTPLRAGRPQPEAGGNSERRGSTLEAVMSEIKDAGPRIVAGVDGSASAREALRWAIRQAELTSASVDAVTAWEYPAAYGGYGMAPVGVADDVDFAGFAEKTVTEEVAAAAG